MAEFSKLYALEKPDSLRYYNVKTAISMYTIYDELGDIVGASRWLDIAERELAAARTTRDFREDAEARIHGSKAAILIDEGKLDSAYKEVKIVRELARDPKTRMGALIQTAQIYQMKNQPQAARNYLEQALSISEDSSMRRTALYMMALCYIAEKQYDEALRVLNSYHSETIRSNTRNNLRAYYIIRAQAYAGTGNLVLAYNSLDSALVVTDSIMAGMRRHQAESAETYIKTADRADHAEQTLSTLTTWCIALAVTVILLCGFVIAFLYRYFKLNRRLHLQRTTVNEARMIIEISNREKEEARKRDELQNKRHSALLLQLAGVEGTLTEIKKRLASRELTADDRKALIRKLNEIGGKEKIFDLFSKQFELSNHKFIELLRERHPNLSKTEQRICMFMLINLSTKEIAELLDRSPRTVDATKYSIRKKLGVDSRTEEYLQSIAATAEHHSAGTPFY